MAPVIHEKSSAVQIGIFLWVEKKEGGETGMLIFNLVA